MIKTLSDEITATITYPVSDKDASYVYRISVDGTIIFTGNFFAEKGTSKVEIYLNDIIRNYMPTVNILNQYVQYITVNNVANRMMKTFNIVYIYQGLIRSSGSVTVYMAYKYPFRDYFLEEPKNITVKPVIYPAIQGVNINTQKPISELTCVAMPHYPNVRIAQLNIGLRFVRDTSFENSNYGNTTICELDKDENIISNIVSYGGLGGKDTTYVAINSNIQSLTNNTKYVGIYNEQLMGHTVHPIGKKLYKITVEGQYAIEDEDVAEFAETYGYSSFYNSHMYIQTSNSEVIQYIYETNDPDTDILQLYNSIVTEQHRMSYEEVHSVDKACVTMLVKDEFRRQWPAKEAYDDFIRWMTELIPDIDEQYINEQLFVNKENGISNSKAFIIKFPYIVPDMDALLEFCKVYIEDFKDSKGLNYSTFFEVGSVSPGNLGTYDENYSETITPNVLKFAAIDECPAKYYVQWIDRYGGVQCQPFNGKEVKSIDYSATTITNKIGHRRPIGYNNTIKFDLNTKYLSDEEVPIYEGICVSPYIKVIDTQTNKVYDVIATKKSYTEATHKNQKKLVNFNVTFELTNNENILY